MKASDHFSANNMITLCEILCARRVLGDPILYVVVIIVIDFAKNRNNVIVTEIRCGLWICEIYFSQSYRFLPYSDHYIWCRTLVAKDVRGTVKLYQLPAVYCFANNNITTVCMCGRTCAILFSLVSESNFCRPIRFDHKELRLKESQVAHRGWTRKWVGNLTHRTRICVR